MPDVSSHALHEAILANNLKQANGFRSSAEARTVLGTCGWSERQTRSLLAAYRDSCP